MKKKFLKITGIMVLLIALGSFWGYNKYFKPDPKIQQQLNNQFGAEFFTSFNDEKTVKNSGAINPVKSGDNLEEKADVPKMITSTSGNETIAGESKPVTQDEINSKYEPQFNYLQSVALSRIDTLYSAAIQEYKQRSKAGTLNRSELVQKYIQAGTMLEANVDSQFYSTLDAMQADLIANNLSTDSIGAIKGKYEKAKSSKRSQLLAKVGK
ncbi:MAG: hypothetical protein P4L49_14095 [Desulfosporosinus sp.]|nr:hypothetical protein [Desulfosporosinus sp.]